MSLVGPGLMSGSLSPGPYEAERVQPHRHAGGAPTSSGRLPLDRLDIGLLESGALHPQLATGVIGPLTRDRERKPVEARHAAGTGHVCGWARRRADRGHAEPYHDDHEHAAHAHRYAGAESVEIGLMRLKLILPGRAAFEAI
jgi:hypothetical protein